jgi:hypothetical protein
MFERNQQVTIQVRGRNKNGRILRQITKVMIGRKTVIRWEVAYKNAAGGESVIDLPWYRISA